MFENFCNTPNKYQHDEHCRSITLVEEQQNQKHIVVFDVEKNIEYFDIKPFISNIKSIKACDYVLVNHTDKKILFCELKNTKGKNDAVKQLWHSKNIINCLINISKKGIKYKQGYVIINKKSLNKGKTKKEFKLIPSQHFKYIYTGQTTINFSKLHYE